MYQEHIEELSINSNAESAANHSRFRPDFFTKRSQNTSVTPLRCVPQFRQIVLKKKYFSPRLARHIFGNDIIFFPVLLLEALENAIETLYVVSIFLINAT